MSAWGLVSRGGIPLPPPWLCQYSHQVRTPAGSPSEESSAAWPGQHAINLFPKDCRSRTATCHLFDGAEHRRIAANFIGWPSGPVPTKDHSPVTRARSPPLSTLVTFRSNVPFAATKLDRASRIPGKPLVRLSGKHSVRLVEGHERI